MVVDRRERHEHEESLSWLLAIAWKALQDAQLPCARSTGSRSGHRRSGQKIGVNSVCWRCDALHWINRHQGDLEGAFELCGGLAILRTHLRRNLKPTCPDTGE